MHRRGGDDATRSQRLRDMGCSVWQGHCAGQAGPPGQFGALRVNVDALRVNVDAPLVNVDAPLALKPASARHASLRETRIGATLLSR